VPKKPVVGLILSKYLIRYKIKRIFGYRGDERMGAALPETGEMSRYLRDRGERNVRGLSDCAK